MMNLLRAAAVAAAALFLAACGDSSSDAPADAPANVTVTPGDTAVTVSWTTEPGLTYWVFSAQASSITRDNYLQFAGARITQPARSPQLITGLTNGVTYSFIVNATRDGGPAGPASPSISAVPRIAGGVWTPGTPLAADLNGLTFGFGKYHAVGAGGAWFTSSDAASGSWTAGSSGTTVALNGIATGTNLIAVGDGGTIIGSADGTAWTARTSNTTANLNGIAALGSLFIAVGNDGTIRRSTDAGNWIAITSGTTAHLRGVGFAGPQTIAVGDGGTLLTSSDSGQNWTVRNSGVSANLYSLAASSASVLFVMVGDAGTVLTSTDGSTWTAQPPISGAPNLKRVVYGTQFIAVGDGGAVYTSADGTSWTQATSNTTADLRGLLRGIALNYVAVGTGGANITTR